MSDECRVSGGPAPAFLLMLAVCAVMGSAYLMGYWQGREEAVRAADERPQSELWPRFTFSTESAVGYVRRGDAYHFYCAAPAPCPQPTPRPKPTPEPPEGWSRAHSLPAWPVRRYTVGDCLTHKVNRISGKVEGFYDPNDGIRETLYKVLDDRGRLVDYASESLWEPCANRNGG